MKGNGKRIIKTEKEGIHTRMVVTIKEISKMGIEMDRAFSIMTRINK